MGPRGVANHNQSVLNELMQGCDANAPLVEQVPLPQFAESTAASSTFTPSFSPRNTASSASGVPPASSEGSVNDSYSEGATDFEGDDCEILLRPCGIPGKLSRTSVPAECIDSEAFDASNDGCIRLSEYVKLQEGIRGMSLSVGSALHIGDMHNSLCRVCSFHKPPNRLCAKGALCEFCHLHAGKRNSRRKPDTPHMVSRMTWAQTEIPVLRGIRL
mmetsp:Transcript_19678/g.36976  ORF Transcript_19678/g.36976 Transcript_19678/m.36976 type:complete len:216 (-) Transcript_19678:188-835(-)